VKFNFTAFDWKYNVWLGPNHPTSQWSSPQDFFRQLLKAGSTLANITVTSLTPETGVNDVTPTEQGADNSGFAQKKRGFFTGVPIHINRGAGFTLVRELSRGAFL